MTEFATFTRAVSAIYDAAVEPDLWDQALVSIAEAMSASQSALMVLNGGRLVAGIMPLMDPEDLQTYAEIQQHTAKQSSIETPATAALGKVVGIDDPRARENFTKSTEFKEWWTEHDLGIGALFANVSFGGSRLAQIGLYRPQESGFTSDDRTKFAQLCEHVVRASQIQQRFRLGSAKANMSRDFGHAGFITVDEDYTLLGEDGEVAEMLHRIGLVSTSASGVRKISRNDPLCRLIDETRPPKYSGGSCCISTESGESLWVDVIPVRPGDNRKRDLLNFEKPIALLQLSIPNKRIDLRLKGLAVEFGLTPAEEAVAMEIIKGDGRAATARRLSISESTVRSHLTVIFEKLGIHRQSELVRLLAG
ncbi:helix-turn-helix transcriptional regulator [Erythrobacter sp. YT30]|uniref:helix-turn-helix transcriptional regulator n=1 Tax=Erythrobacter sp. YT30 TaxID=1735012 RepID=UPI00076D2617|nr:helix-turn-helix transcriptional regulator [Erythrobacter sp. YT30]KWV93233.1 hypothetical protein AUC45_03690 [Erythrobacter sp. YT30]